MLSPERIFNNIFSDDTITTARLANFMQDTINRLTKANNSSFASLINQLTPALEALHKELGNVDIAKTLQKGRTLLVDGIMDSFKKNMSNLEGVIAHALGGSNTAAYLEFYPQGITEYSKATKLQMPVLTARVQAAATANATALGEDIAGLLQSFATEWNDAHVQQQQIKGSVSGSRNERDAARTDAETALYIAVHTIATVFPSNVQQCLSYFDFGLLHGATHTTPTNTPASSVSEQKQGA